MKFHNCHHTWWAGGGYIGSWMESTAFAAEMEPMVERWETVTAQPAASRPANMEVAASSSWWLLLVTSSGPQCWPLVEADFFARKQRGIVWNTEMVIRNCKASEDYTFTCGWEATLTLAELNNVGNALFLTSMPMWRQNKNQKKIPLLAFRDSS